MQAGNMDKWSSLQQGPLGKDTTVGMLAALAEQDTRLGPQKAADVLCSRENPNLLWTECSLLQEERKIWILKWNVPHKRTCGWVHCDRVGLLAAVGSLTLVSSCKRGAATNREPRSASLEIN